MQRLVDQAYTLAVHAASLNRALLNGYPAFRIPPAQFRAPHPGQLGSFAAALFAKLYESSRDSHFELSFASNQALTVSWNHTTQSGNVDRATISLFRD